MMRRAARIVMPAWLAWLGAAGRAEPADTWVLWARPCQLGAPACTGDWQRRETFDAERWCRAALTTAVNKALTPEGQRTALTKGEVLEYRCLPERK